MKNFFHPNSVKYEASWMILGNITFALAQAVNAMLIARISGPEALGVFSYGLAIATPLMLLSNLGLRNQLITDVNCIENFRYYQILRQIGSIFGLVSVIIVALVLAPNFTVMAVSVIIGMYKAIENQAELLYGAQQCVGNNRAIAISLILRGMAGAFALGITMYLTQNIIMASFAYTMSTVAVWYMNDRHEVPINLQNPSSSTKRIWQLQKELYPILYRGGPLGVTSFLLNLSVQVPRLILGHSAGIVQLGLFTSMTQLVQMGVLIINSIGQTIAPKLSQHYADRHINDYVRLTLQGTGLAVALGLIGWLCAVVIGEWVLAIAFGPDFAQQHSLLIWFFIFTPVIYVNNLWGYMMMAVRQDNYYLIAQLMGMVTVIVGAFILVPNYGAMGAILATAIGSLVVCLGYGAVIVYTLRNPS